MITRQNATALLLAASFMPSAFTPAVCLTAAENDSSAQATETQSETQVEAETNTVDTEFSNLMHAIHLTDDIAKDKKNVMLSPTSLNFALGMLAEGADGKTKEELTNYLGCSDFSTYAKNYLDKMGKFNYEHGGYMPNGALNDTAYTAKLKLANAIWMDKQLPINDAYQTFVEDYFHGMAKTLDFSDAMAACQEINGWAEKNTEGMISDIISPESISQDSKLCITNSVYFESPWAKEPWDVEPEETIFTALDGKQETTRFLTTDADAYYENENATAFGRNYDNGLEFIGILPKKEGAFTLQGLDIQSLLSSNPTYDSVEAKMPRLDFTTSAELTEILKTEGLTTALSDKADYSGISKEALAVGHILQKTNLQLDENGTKAAAVTAITMETCSLPVQPENGKEVVLNRPFAFLIYDSESKEVLFMGKVVTSQMEK